MTLSQILAYWNQSNDNPQLPRWRQIVEMAALYAFRSIGPGYYVQARWGRAEVRFSDKWNHMNRAEYRKFIATWNPPDYHKLSQHKLIEKSVIQLSGLPSPTYVGFAHKERGRDGFYNPVRSGADLDKLLRTVDGKRVCFKRVEGYGGKGFQSYRIEVAADGVRMIHPITAEVMTPAQWWGEFGDDAQGYLIELHQTQHETLAALNPSSLNTVRLWVYVTPRASEVVGGYLRIGRETSMVDNTSSGGLVGVLDAASGRVTGFFDPVKCMSEVSMKTASNPAMRNLQLPYWDRVTQLAKDALRVFPNMSVVGLDIAFGPDGPVLIELNVIPDYIGCAWMALPLRYVDQRMRAS